MHELNKPALTEKQKQELFEREDHGVTPVTGITRFPTFEDWMKTGGVLGPNKNNYFSKFGDEPIVAGISQASQHFQRFILLYPERFKKLHDFTVGFERRSLDDPALTEDLEKDYWTAYEELADLVDVNDHPPTITADHEMPRGQAHPSLLTG